MKKSWPDFLTASPSQFLTTIKLFIVWLLNCALRPSTRDLLRAVRQATGFDASKYFEETLISFADEGQFSDLGAVAGNKKLRREDRSYFRAIFADSSVNDALAGRLTRMKKTFPPSMPAAAVGAVSLVGGL